MTRKVKFALAGALVAAMAAGLVLASRRNPDKHTFCKTRSLRHMQVIFAGRRWYMASPVVIGVSD